LLKSCYFPDIAYRGVFDDLDDADDVDGFIYKITMNLPIELREDQKAMLLQEVRAVYGYGIENLEFIEKHSTRNANVISTNQAQPQPQPQPQPQAQPQPQTQTQDLKSAIPASLQPVFVERNSIWHNIREDLKRAYGEGIFISWFGKLEPEEDKETKQLTLKAPTGFIADWIKDKYQSVIEAYCELEQYELAGIVAR
jgi:hypothetical protein